jgi:hypothetical protein
MLFFAVVANVRVASAQRLDDIVLHITDAWQRHDAKDVIALSARDGIAIESRDLRTGPLGSRQAAAVLRRMFDERETVAIQPGRTQIVGGSPRRAYAEIIWITRAPDTSEPQRATIFLELVLLDERWQITQIRLLP